MFAERKQPVLGLLPCSNLSVPYKSCLNASEITRPSRRAKHGKVLRLRSTASYELASMSSAWPASGYDCYDTADQSDP